MNYVESFKIGGVDAAQIPCIKGSGVPNIATVGAVGCFYMDIDTGNMYKCTAVNDGVYTWVEVGTDKNPDRHAEYFDITNDGIISLKPEYRGATSQSTLPYSISDNGAGVVGSKNIELPKYLAIPEIVDGVTVNSLAEGMFCDNTAIVDVVLPYMITAIPQYCFNVCSYLQEVYNTENITELGERAFRRCSSLKRAKFPNLKSMGTNAFTGCARLIYADVGNVTELPLLAFAYDAQLQRIKNNGKLKTVGEAAFCKVTSLTDFENVENLTEIVKGAFIGPKIDFDWNSLTGCTFGDNATPAQFNPENIGDGVGIGYEPCENPLPTYFAQTDPALNGRLIGKSGRTYDNGCALFSFIHSYCGLKNIHFSTIYEMEAAFNAINPDILDTFVGDDDGIQRLCRLTGITHTVRENCISDTDDKNKIVKELYDAVADGKYVLFAVDDGYGKMEGHLAVVYGINSDGELLCVDSSSRYYDDFSKPFTYPFRFEKLCSPNKALHILSLKEE